MGRPKGKRMILLFGLVLLFAAVVGFLPTLLQISLAIVIVVFVIVPLAKMLFERFTR